MFDELGDILKDLEHRAEPAPMPRDAWIVARLDGRGFSRCTGGMIKPFDARIHAAMLAAARFAMDDFDAVLAYQQSDEITLVWAPIEGASERPFGGRRSKWISSLASDATAAFGDAIRAEGGDTMSKRMPRFDARLIDPLDQAQAAAFLAWRSQDARRNGLTAAAHALFGHKTLQGANAATKHALLESADRPFSSFPDPLRNGTLLTRVRSLQSLSEAERMAIPERKRPSPDALFERRPIVSTSNTYLGDPADAETALADALAAMGKTP